MRFFLATALLSIALGAAEIRLGDDFSQQGKSPTGIDWEANVISWQKQQGQLHSEGPGLSEAFPSDRRVYRTAKIEVVMTPRRAIDKKWKIAGVALHLDARNFWHLALVESPDDKGSEHFVELSEMRDGQWLSQGNLKALAEKGGKFAWSYDTPYRLRLSVSPEGIDGRILDLSGRELAHLAYGFTAPAVTEGRPSLRTSQIVADFDDFSLVADGDSSRILPLPEEKTFPSYAVKGSGRKASIQGNGFFQTVKEGDRWWLVDPRGELFYAVGTDHVNFYSHWCQTLGYAPYHKNAKKRHGTVEAWSKSASKRLRNWGFNLLGAGNISAVRYQGLAHTLFAAFGSSFSGYSALVEKVHWTGFPNVFDPRWEAYCNQRAEKQCKGNRNDPWLLGYFLDNELEWYGKTHREDGIWTAVMEWPREHTGKQALVTHLRQSHATIADFNQAWEQKAATWDDVAELNALPASGNRAREIQLSFLREVADRYFRIGAAAIRKADPNHLIIGSRFAGRAPEWAWKACAKYCDVVTFNHYPRIDMETEDLSPLAETFGNFYKLVDKPMMITEWSFPALDAGLPCTHGAGMRVDTQEQKTHCVEMMQHLHFRLPFMVGSDYFMWADEPAEGISDTFPEDSNYGLNNVNDNPYPLLTAMFSKLNPLAIKLHAGDIPEGYIETASLADGKFSLTIRNASAKPATFTAAIRAGDKLLATPRIALEGNSQGTVSIKSGAKGMPFGGGTDGEAPRALEVELLQKKEGWLPRGGRGATKTILYNPGNSPENSLIIHNPGGGIREGVNAILFPPGESSLSNGFGNLVCNNGDRLPIAWLGSGAISLQLSQLPGKATLVGRLEKMGQNTTTKTTSTDGFRIDNGFLRLEHDGSSGNVIDRFQIGDLLLGSYNPLVWQHPKDNQWTGADTFVKAVLQRSNTATVVDVTCEYQGGEAITAVDATGKMPDPAATSARFRITHRFVVWPNCPYIAARLVAIRNLEPTRPLNLNGYFFYLPSNIGGNQSNDKPESNAIKVPNYYRKPRGTAWHDDKVGARYGVVPAGEGLDTYFWLNKAGGQHPDAHVKIKPTIQLAPGKEYLAPANAPVALIYGAKDDSWEKTKLRLDTATQLKLQIQ